MSILDVSVDPGSALIAFGALAISAITGFVAMRSNKASAQFYQGESLERLEMRVGRLEREVEDCERRYQRLMADYVSLRQRLDSGG